MGGGGGGSGGAWKEERRGYSSPDFSAGRQNITQDGRSSRQDDKGIGVRAGGGCAKNDCR